MPTDAADRRADLRADCGRCVGLCCVALPFARSTDFAFDKAAGMSCPHLTGDDRCEIHARLRGEGFPGCEVFDCFGAGQQVVQVTLSGRSWRDGPEIARGMFDAFGTLRAVHEMRWYLADAAGRDLPDELTREVAEAAERLATVSNAGAEDLARFDVDGVRAAVGALLGRVSASVRAGLGGPDLRGRDLAGRAFRGESLRGADLRGALLLGADLHAADLRSADLLGADLRGTVLGGADLTEALFLTAPQLAAALGDARTRIPEPLDPPRHWNSRTEPRSR
ncbi:MAG TPA: pentapeptide repeat-containing protein [Lapillicoccus sp.]